MGKPPTRPAPPKKPQKGGFSKRVKDLLDQTPQSRVAVGIPKLAAEKACRELSAANIGFLSKKEELHMTKLTHTLEEIRAKDLVQFEQALASAGVSKEKFALGLGKLLKLRGKGLKIIKMPDGTCNFTSSVVDVVARNPELAQDVDFVFHNVIEPINFVVKSRQGKLKK